MEASPDPCRVRGTCHAVLGPGMRWMDRPRSRRSVVHRWRPEIPCSDWHMGRRGIAWRRSGRWHPALRQRGSSDVPRRRGWGPPPVDARTKTWPRPLVRLIDCRCRPGPQNHLSSASRRSRRSVRVGRVVRPAWSGRFRALRWSTQPSDGDLGERRAQGPPVRDGRRWTPSNLSPGAGRGRQSSRHRRSHTLGNRRVCSGSSTQS